MFSFIHRAPTQNYFKAISFCLLFLHMSQYSVHVCSKLDVNELLVCTIPVNIIFECLSLAAVLSYLISNTFLIHFIFNKLNVQV